MKHFKDATGKIFAFESDGSQDYLIKPGMQPISEHAAAELTAPPSLTPEQELEQWRQYATVSRRQAKQQLYLAGLLSSIQPAIDDIEDDTERQMVQIYWDDATVFERAHPELIGLGHALGLDAGQIDQLFIDAAKL